MSGEPPPFCNDCIKETNRNYDIVVRRKFGLFWVRSGIILKYCLCFFVFSNAGTEYYLVSIINSLNNSRRMRSKDSKKIIKVKIPVSYIDGLLVGLLTGSVNRS